jgi:uncharacterized protein YebE (UPF0316 family)
MIGSATMKTFVAILSVILVSGMMVSATAADKLQHVVCFKFKTTATAQDIRQVEEAFQALKQKIPQVVTLEWGTNVSKEKRDKGFTHCFLLSFKSEADRDAYIEHPAHKAFGKLVGPVLDDVFVLDFWAKD